MSFLSPSPFSIVNVGEPMAITSLTTPITIDIPFGAYGVILQGSGSGSSNIRYTLDGSTPPSTTLGFRLSVDGTPTRLDLYPGAKVRVRGAASASVSYQFFYSPILKGTL